MTSIALSDSVNKCDGRLAALEVSEVPSGSLPVEIASVGVGGSSSLRPSVDVAGPSDVSSVSICGFSEWSWSGSAACLPGCSWAGMKTCPCTRMSELSGATTKASETFNRPFPGPLCASSSSPDGAALLPLPRAVVLSETLV